MTSSRQPRLILITGASGLVGSHTVKRLISKGLKVRALLRASSVEEWRSKLDPAVEIVTGDLLDPPSLKRACQGCDVVVHTAAVVDAHARTDLFYKVNVEGTEHLLDAAVEAGVEQFVHISSLSVINGYGDKFKADEKSPFIYSSEPYANSKIDAEKLVMSRTRHLNITCLRPGFIYGPEERTWLPRVINSLQSGSAWLVDGGFRETNVIYVQNLCSAIEKSLLNSRTYGEIYNLTDGKCPTKKELFDTISDVLGLPRLKRSMPRPMAFLLCESVSLLALSLPDKWRLRLGRYSRGAYRLVAINQGFDVSKAVRELSYTDTIPFSEGMKETIISMGLKAATTEAQMQPSGRNVDQPMLQKLGMAFRSSER